jgi:hypothetical protein
MREGREERPKGKMGDERSAGGGRRGGRTEEGSRKKGEGGTFLA